jgi:hypothetical protein
VLGNIGQAAARGLAEVRVVEFRASQRARDLPERIA